MRRKRGRLIRGSRVPRAPERYNDRCRGRQVSLQAPRRPHAEDGSQKESQVELADMDEQPFQDVGVAPQVGAAHASGFVGNARSAVPGTRCGAAAASSRVGWRHADGSRRGEWDASTTQRCC